MAETQETDGPPIVNFGGNVSFTPRARRDRGLGVPETSFTEADRQWVLEHAAMT